MIVKKGDKITDYLVTCLVSNLPLVEEERTCFPGGMVVRRCILKDGMMERAVFSTGHLLSQTSKEAFIRQIQH